MGTLIQAPTAPPTGTVIFLHGLGQSNVTWAHGAVKALAKELPHILWLLPQGRVSLANRQYNIIDSSSNSPHNPVTLNEGERRPSWFDIAHLPPHDDEHDKAGIAVSVSIIEGLIRDQVDSGIDSRKVVLVEFSQGAALSLIVALTTQHKLGGVASLSGWIPIAVREQMVHAAQDLPILWCHGDTDNEIPLSLGEDAVRFIRSKLRIKEPRLHFNEYADLGHAVNDKELEDLVSWLRGVMA